MSEKSLHIQSIERAGVSMLYNVAGRAGLKYLEHAQPYIQVAATAIKGIHVIRKNAEINKMMTTQAKAHYKNLSSIGFYIGKNALQKGLSGIPASPYIKAVQVVTGAINKAIGRDSGIEW